MKKQQKLHTWNILGPDPEIEGILFFAIEGSQFLKLCYVYFLRISNGKPLERFSMHFLLVISRRTILYQILRVGLILHT